jgi:hypothetical protein
MDGPVFFPLRPSLEPPAVAGRVPLSVVLHEYLQSGWPVVPWGGQERAACILLEARGGDIGMAEIEPE